MTTNTTINGWPLPSLTDQPNITTAENSALVLVDRRVNSVFATTTARDLAIVSPDEGMECYVTGNKEKYRYDGARWVGASWRTHHFENTTTINNTVTVADLADVNISMEPNSVYQIDIQLCIQTLVGAGIRWNFNTPVGTSGYYMAEMPYIEGVPAPPGDQFSDRWGGAPTPGLGGGLGIERGFAVNNNDQKYLLFRGCCVTAAAGGSLQMKVAQQTAVVADLKFFGFTEANPQGTSLWRSLKIR